MVRIHPDPPEFAGAVAQLGEHLLCKQGVAGSNPVISTRRDEIEASLARDLFDNRIRDSRV